MRFAPLVPKPKPTDSGRHIPRQRPFVQSFVAPSARLQRVGDPSSDFSGVGAPWEQELPACVSAKLEVGDANDPREREADAIADRVMRMPVSSDDASNGHVAPESDLASELEEEELSEAPTVTAFASADALPRGAEFVAQRKCASCEAEEENEIRRSLSGELLMRTCSTCEDEDQLQRACTSCFATDQTDDGEQLRRESAAGAHGGPTTPLFTSRLRERQRLGGQPLTPSARSFFEPRFAADLSEVRIHTDPVASELAQQINARAFTAGQHIFIGPGEHRPQAQSGLHLMAHELAHTLQNGVQRTDEFLSREGQHGNFATRADKTWPNYIRRFSNLGSRHDLTPFLQNHCPTERPSTDVVPPGVLPKLEFSDADSPSERQADAVADRVMSTSSPPSVAVEHHGGESRGNAADAELPTEQADETDEHPVVLDPRAQTQPLARKPSAADYQRAARRGGAAPSGFDQRLRSIRGRGRRLDSRARSFLEPRFGTALDFVRIHDDAGSAELAHSIHALAFTHGTDVFFARGQYRPATQAGLGLLAHEITHTLQNVGSDALANIGPSVPVNSGDEVSRFLLPFAPSLVLPAAMAAKLQYMAWSELVEWLEEQVEYWRYANLDIRGLEVVPITLQCAAAYANWKDWHFEIDAHYGSLAAGTLVLGYDLFSGVETLEHAEWLITHADVRDVGQDSAMLQVHVDEDDIHGQIGPMGNRASAFAYAQKFVGYHQWIFDGGLAAAFGLTGLEILDARPITNELSGGYLHFQLENLEFLSGEFVPGVGEFKFYDQSLYFAGEGSFDNLPGEGSATIEFVRDVGSGQPALGADASIAIEHESLSGSLEVAYLNGVWTATGIAEYEDEALKGKVAFGLSDRKHAFELISEAVSKYTQSTGFSQGLAGAIEDEQEPGFYALGDLQFDFGEWMQGSTTVAIDPDGDYVAGFEWTPTAKIPVTSPPLLPLGPKGTTTGPIEAFEVPLHPGAIIAGGTAYVDVELRAFASLGPGSIHDIYLQGLLSSSPYFFNTLALGAQLDVPGRAELRVLVTGAVVVSFFSSDALEIAKGGVTIEGVARLRSNGSAEVNSHVAWNDEHEPTFGIDGKAELESQLDLIFKGTAFAEFAQEKVWGRELFNRVYQLDAGSFHINFAWDSQGAASAAQTDDDSQAVGDGKRCRCRSGSA